MKISCEYNNWQRKRVQKNYRQGHACQNGKQEVKLWGKREREEVRKYLKLLAAKNVVQNDKKNSHEKYLRGIWKFLKELLQAK